MSQWSQPGSHYPLQTGFQPEQLFQPDQHLDPAAQFQQLQGSFGAQPGASGWGPGFTGISPQPTGIPGARAHGLQPSQQPGAPGIGANQDRLCAPSAAGPSFAAPDLATQPTGVGPLSPPTGIAGRATALSVPQVTGFVDPRLQMMPSSFTPASASAPYSSGGAPQLAPLLQQQLNGLSPRQMSQLDNRAHGRGMTPKLLWALSKAEKQYDQIFRAWDPQGTGFINGQTGLDVFGQSGLDKVDLANIWTLVDVDNRGKLNLAEFQVAMGLIYRRLNGNDVPDELPAELVPPSSRDLDTSRLKNHSFTPPASFAEQDCRQSAAVWMHDDAESTGEIHQPRNRHVNRSAVRSRADDASPAIADLSSIKRQLNMPNDKLANERSSDALDRILEDLSGLLITRRP